MVVEQQDQDLSPSWNKGDSVWKLQFAASLSEGSNSCPQPRRVQLIILTLDSRSKNWVRERKCKSHFRFVSPDARHAMPHADSLSLPPSAIRSKAAFYAHVESTLLALLSPSQSGTDRIQGNWVTQLSNAAALLNGSYENYSRFGREDGERINWCGSSLLPSPAVR